MDFKLLYFRTIVSGLCLSSIMLFGLIGCMFFGLFIGEFFFLKREKKPLDEREKELSLKSDKMSLILITFFLMIILQLTHFELTHYTVEEIIWIMSASLYFFTSISKIYTFKKNSAF